MAIVRVCPGCGKWVPVYFDGFALDGGPRYQRYEVHLFDVRASVVNQCIYSDRDVMEVDHE